jgi:hypothetical protein
MKHFVNSILIIILLVAIPQAVLSKNKPQFPIAAWMGVIAQEAPIFFPQIRASGINLLVASYKDTSTLIEMLDLAQKNRIKLIASSSNSLRVNTRGMVDSVKENKGLYGYFVKDEPETTDFNWLSQLVSQIQSYDSTHPCYINLYPNWAWDVDKYKSRVDDFASNVNVPFLSFDNYPIVSINNGPNVMRPDWYRNLEDMSSSAREHNKPFWAFALALSHRLDPTQFYNPPSYSTLQLQVYTDLAYGAQGIQYYTFKGLVDKNCNRLPQFDYIKSINQEIQNLRDVFMGAKVKGIWHTGQNIPRGTKQLVSLPTGVNQLQTLGEGALVSLLNNGQKDYLVIVNRDYLHNMQLNIAFDHKVKKILKSGAKVKTPISENVILSPGNMVIYRLDK